MNRPEDIAVYGGYDSSGLVDIGGGGQWKLMNGILRML